MFTISCEKKCLEISHTNGMDPARVAFPGHQNLLRHPACVYADPYFISALHIFSHNGILDKRVEKVGGCSLFRKYPHGETTEVVLSGPYTGFIVTEPDFTHNPMIGRPCHPWNESHFDTSLSRYILRPLLLEPLNVFFDLAKDIGLTVDKETALENSQTYYEHAESLGYECKVVLKRDLPRNYQEAINFMAEN